MNAAGILELTQVCRLYFFYEKAARKDNISPQMGPDDENRLIFLDLVGNIEYNTSVKHQVCCGGDLYK